MEAHSGSVDAQVFTLSAVPQGVTDDCDLKSAQWSKNIRAVDLDEGNMIFTAIYTTLACVTLPLNGITHKVASYSRPVWIIMCSLLHGRHRVRTVNSKSYSECQKCFCVHSICYFCFVFTSLT